MRFPDASHSTVNGLWRSGHVNNMQFPDMWTIWGRAWLHQTFFKKLSHLLHDPLSLRCTHPKSWFNWWRATWHHINAMIFWTCRWYLIGNSSAKQSLYSCKNFILCLESTLDSSIWSLTKIKYAKKLLFITFLIRTWDTSGIVSPSSPTLKTCSQPSYRSYWFYNHCMEQGTCDKAFPQHVTTIQGCNKKVLMI